MCDTQNIMVGSSEQGIPAHSMVYFKQFRHINKAKSKKVRDRYAAKRYFQHEGS